MFNHGLLVYFQKANNNLTINKSYIALAFGVLLFLSGCDIKSAELNAMESAVSIIELQSGREVSRRYQDREPKPLLGKPKEPEFRIEYEPINHFTQEDVYDEIAAILEKNNWEREELSIAQSGYFKASLPQGDLTIVAEVLIHSMSNIVSIHLGTVLTVLR